MKTKKTPSIPEKFYKAGQHPRAYNVGDLADLLSELPRNMPISDGWGGAPEVVVFNHGQPDMHLQLYENDND